MGSVEVETTAQTNNDICGALSTFDANDEDWTVSPTNAGFFQHGPVTTVEQERTLRMNSTILIVHMRHQKAI
jgi:hypothetical protein